MTRIGVLSDTHSFLDEKIRHHFKDVDLIIHAGDIGNQQVTDELKLMKPLIAVYGNIDDHLIRAEFPENQLIQVEGCKIFITHIAGAVEKYTTRIKPILQAEKPDILICGHSHILKVMKDKTYQLLHINPGAAGIHGFHKVRTILRFEIHENRPQKMELIELGFRGKID